MVQGRLCLTSNLRGGFPSYDLVTMRSTWHTYLEGEDVMVGSVVLIKATLLIVPCSLFTTLKIKVVFPYFSHPTLTRPVCLAVRCWLGFWAADDRAGTEGQGVNTWRCTKDISPSLLNVHYVCCSKDYKQI